MCCRDPSCQGRVWGAGRSPVPHRRSPLNISVGIAPPITNPVPLPVMRYPELPQKHPSVLWWGAAPGLGAQPSPPPPAGKQHLGFQRDSCVLNPIFQMDGGRHTGQVTCLKVTRGQRGEGLAALRGGLVPHSQRDGDSEPCSWAQGRPVGPPPPSPGRQAGSCPGIPRGMHAWNTAPQQPQGGSLLPGMAQVGMCLAGQRLSKHVGAQVGALRGTETEQERKLLPRGHLLPPGGPLCPSL